MCDRPMQVENSHNVTLPRDEILYCSMADTNEDGQNAIIMILENIKSKYQKSNSFNCSLYICFGISEEKPFTNQEILSHQ